MNAALTVNAGTGLAPAPPNRNTVQIFIPTACSKVFFRSGRFRCSGRHLFQRDILRLIRVRQRELDPPACRPRCNCHGFQMPIRLAPVD